MHTGEYEISLSRELAVCKNTIQRIKKTLLLLEQKHNKKTEEFIEELRRAKESHDPCLKDDYEAWEGSHDSLKRWEALEKQYQEAYRKMKI